MPSPVATGGLVVYPVNHAGAATGQNRLLGPDQELALTGPRQKSTDTAALVGE